MIYAQLIEGQWQQLDGRDVAVGDAIASFQTVSLWSDSERAEHSIKTIVDDTTEPPEGKVRESSSIVDVSGVPTRIWSFVDAPPAPVPASISDRQFAHVLAKLGLIEPAEALAWIKVGDVPTALQAVVDTIPDETERFDAQMLLSGATTFERSHPMTAALAAGLGKTSDDLDAIWRMGAQL